MRIWRRLEGTEYPECVRGFRQVDRRFGSPMSMPRSTRTMDCRQRTGICAPRIRANTSEPFRRMAFLKRFMDVGHRAQAGRTASELVKRASEFIAANRRWRSDAQLKIDKDVAPPRTWHPIAASWKAPGWHAG